MIAFVSRHRLALGLGILVLLRAALPWVLRPLLERQASQAINAQVTIGDVDLALYRAGIALDDVAVRPASWTPGSSPDEPPLIAWRRLAVAVQWLPLFRKTVQLRELLLDSPRVAIDRLQDGGLNVAALVPESEPAAEDEAESTGGSTWRFGIDRVILNDGGVRFRDLMFERTEPIELSLGSFEVEDIALSPGVYSEPARLRLRGRVDDGRFDIEAGFLPRRDGGFVVTSRVKARRLPLNRTRVYVPEVGWSELEGEGGGVFEYVLETGGRNELRGHLTVDGLIVHVSQLEEPGLAWKRLAVRVDPVDLAGHRATVKFIDLSGMWLVARARGGIVLPFLEALLTGKPTDDDPAAPAAPPASAPATPAAGDPWRWSIGILRVYESLVHVISPDTAFDAGVDLTIRRLHGDEGDVAPVSLTLGVEGGTVTTEGALRVRPLGFAGSIKTTALPLPNVLTTAGVFPPGVLQRAHLETDLDLAVGVLAPTAGDARVAGSISLLEPYLRGAGGPTTELGASRITVGIGELLVPGALTEEPTVVAADARLTGGTVSAQELWVVRTDPTPLDVRLASFDLSLEEVTAPGAGPAPADGGALRLRGGVTVGGVAVADAGGSGFDLALGGAALTLGELLAPGIRAADRAAVTAPVQVSKATLTLTAPAVTKRGTGGRAAAADTIALAAENMVVPGALGGPPGQIEVRGARLDLAQPSLSEPSLVPLDFSARTVGVAAGALWLPGPASPPESRIRARSSSLSVIEPRLDDPGDGFRLRARKVDLGADDLEGPGTATTLVRGARLRLVEPSAAGPDPREFLVAARAVGVDADAIALAADAPGQVRLRAVTLTGPRVQLLRTSAGLRLPGQEVPRPGSEPVAAPEPAATPPPGPGLDLAIATFRLSDGRVSVSDRTVKPPFTGGLTDLRIEADDVRWPERSADRLRIEASTTQAGKVVISGSLTPSGGKLDVTGTEIPLRQFNPYAAGMSPYSIRRGRLSVTTKATFDSRKYDSTTAITLEDFDVGGRAGDSLFKEQFGIPLSMALALLRDLNGDIKLQVPVAGDEAGMQVGYRSIIGGALRSALVGALASPLKLVGAVFSGDKVQAAPEPITFRLGRTELTDDGAKQIAQIAKFLADRPAMGIAIGTAPTAADARWLHEHEVVKELGAPPGVFGRLRNLVGRGRRERIRQALAERAEGNPGSLDPDDQKALDEWLAEKPQPTPERLRALAQDRLAAVERALRDTHGVGPGRIVRRAAPAAIADDPVPTVDIELGAVADLTAPPEDVTAAPAT